MISRQLKTVFLLSLLVFKAACGPTGTRDSQSPPDSKLPLTNSESSPRGSLISVNLLTTLGKDTLDETFRAWGVSARYGVEIFKVEYQTEDLEGRRIVASGIFMKPSEDLASYPWISLQHGTITSQADAPSASPSEGLFEASQGFYTVVADYLGYGSSQGDIHPYVVAEAYANTGVDLLRAARQWADQNSWKLGPLFLKGYSEGGYATLALQRSLETEYPQEFSVRASAPAAGPYDLSGTSRILLSRSTNSPVNLPFVLLSFERWLSRGDFAIDKILKPDLSLVRRLFSGESSSSDIYRQLPSQTDLLFRPEFIVDYLSARPTLPESKRLLSYLESQNLHDKNWAPKTPTRLYHCQDDEIVPVEATLNALASFEAKAAPAVESVIIKSPDPSRPYTHVTCPAIFSSVAWFAELL